MAILVVSSYLMTVTKLGQSFYWVIGYPDESDIQFIYVWAHEVPLEMTPQVVDKTRQDLER